MYRSAMILLAAVIVSGCTGGVEQELQQTRAELAALKERLAALEQKTAARPHELAIMPVVAPPPAVEVVERDTNLNVVVTPEVAAALADQINALVMSRFEATVDERIAEKVGTADDIEAIFADVVDEEFDARERAEVRAQQERRRVQAAEWDTQGVKRRTSSAGLDEDKQKAVLTAREEMRDRIFDNLPGMKEKGATVEEMLVVVAESRERYETELLDIMGEEEVQKYYEADHMLQRDQRRLQELAESIKPDEQQLVQIVEAYRKRRNTLSDGFMLMSAGYLDRGEMHQGMQQTQSALNDTMKATLTPDQYAAYEESGAGNVHWGHRDPR